MRMPDRLPPARISAVLTFVPILAGLILAPCHASARDTKACADLIQSLNNSPQVIGNNAEMRNYSQQLADKNMAIRGLRSDMRRGGCGGGSIVVLGASAQEACGPMRDQLQALENEREAIVTSRNAAREHVNSQQDRLATLAAIRENGCMPSDLQEQRKAEEMQRLKVRGIELPKDDAYSGVTDLRSAKPAEQTQATAASPAAVRPVAPPPPPDRPYDPTKKVRMVGPVFFPDQQIDLAHPKAEGPQPVQ